MFYRNKARFKEARGAKTHEDTSSCLPEIAVLLLHYCLGKPETSHFKRRSDHTLIQIFSSTNRISSGLEEYDFDRLFQIG